MYRCEGAFSSPFPFPSSFLFLPPSSPAFSRPSRHVSMNETDLPPDFPFLPSVFLFFLLPLPFFDYLRVAPSNTPNGLPSPPSASSTTLTTSSSTLTCGSKSERIRGTSGRLARTGRFVALPSFPSPPFFSNQDSRVGRFVLSSTRRSRRTTSRLISTSSLRDSTSTSRRSVS